MKTAIVTDTNSGIHTTEATELGIFVIPMPVIIDGQTYFEGDTISEKDFFDALTADRHISTSQPSPGDIMDLWDRILSNGYDQLVYIPMSSGLSSSCACAGTLALEYDEKVAVVDNHRISVTLRESVLQAKAFADNGASAIEIKQTLEKQAYQSSIYLAVNTLDYLKKGGRITPAAAMLGTVLSIRPILTIQGEKLDSFAKSRGPMRKAEEKMIAAVRSDLTKRFSDYDFRRLRIGAAGANLTEKQQSQWLTLLAEAFPDYKIYYNPLSASISVHTGPGAVGIGISFR